MNSKILSKPNLFIVGTAKAGTTSLYSYLEKHPDVFMSPIKEPHYFSKDIRCKNFTQQECMNACFDIKKYLAKDKLEKKHIAFVDNLEDYFQLFREAKNEKIIGEISTGYLYSKIAAQEIFKVNPDAKILIVLRDPVQRVYSHWKMNIASGRESVKTSIVDAINNDYHSKDKGYCKSHLYIELGQYFEQIKRYTELFPKENIQILYFEDLTKATDSFMDKVYTFLDINSLKNNYEKENVSVALKYSWLKQLNSKIKISRLIPKNLKNVLKQLLGTTKFPKLSYEEQNLIYSQYFKEDIENIERLFSIDLSSWKYGKKND